MEKQTQAKHKSKIMKFLPKATSSVSFQNPPPENNTSKFKSHQGGGGGGKGFSGPMISIIPAEARGRCRGKYGSIFDTPEPTSPKISCMGQIQHKKKIHKMKKRVAASSQTQQQPQPKPVVLAPPHVPSKPKELKKQTSMTLRRIFGRTKSSAAGRKSDASADRPRKVVVLPERTPSLSQMRRFASGRDTFANFDWTAQVAPVDSDHHRDYYSDEERGDREDEEEKEVIIPFSAPMSIGGGGGGVALEPRKEINLWKRRTMDPPRPLQLNTLFMSK